MSIKLRLIFFLIYLFSDASIVADEQGTKTIFLTGAAGFIGSNFLEYMFNKYEDYKFIVLDALTYAGDLENIPLLIRHSKRFEFYHGSIIDQKLVESLISKSDIVVHFAAESHVSRSIVDDSVFFQTDVIGTRVMMATLVKYVKRVERFIHISTSEVYGTAEYEPMNEGHPLNPRSPYAAAKTGADRLVYAYWCTYDLPAMIMRPFNMYGPRQHSEKVIPRFITNLINDESITIHGSGDQARDWTYVKDLCRAIDLAIHLPNFDNIKNQIINIGSSHAVSVTEIANKIMEIFQISDPSNKIKYISDRPGQVKMHITSTEKAKKLLGWQPRISLGEGLKKTISWYLDHKDIWEKKLNMSVVPISIGNHTEVQ